MPKKSAQPKSKDQNDQATALRFGDKGYVSAFKRAAEEHSKQTMRSQAAALEALVKAGIMTRAGNLTKNYR